MVLLFGTAYAAPLTIDPQHAVFGVVVRKAGIAQGLAHDHLITAAVADSIAFTRETDGGYRFEGRFSAETLAVDDPDLRRRTEPRLIELGLLDDPFGALSERQRSKVRDNMLDENQLDAARFPTIEATLLSLESSEARLSLTIRGVTHERKFKTNIAERDGAIEVEAWGPLLFSDFGIKPYSAALGAVRNRDEFFLYVRFTARTEGG